MILRTLTFSVALAMIGAAPAAAQATRLRPAPSALFRVPMSSPSSDTLHQPKNYAKAGALIVGIPSAIFGAAIGIGLCGLNDSSNDKNCTLSALGFGAFFGALGGATGALIGGQIERH